MGPGAAGAGPTREDCPIPEGFSARLEEQLERLPDRSGGRKWGRRRILVLLAAALALTACTAGTVGIALRQNTIRRVKNEGAGRWEVIKAEEAGEPPRRCTCGKICPVTMNLYLWSRCWRICPAWIRW